MGSYTAHVDTFARDNLPPKDQWPDFLFDLEDVRYPERINCAVEFLDRHVAEGRGDRTLFVTPDGDVSYADFQKTVNRMARVLVEDLGMVTGNRVLIRSANNPTMTAALFAVIKAGGIAVATMPLLRAVELAAIVDKAEIALALCDARLADEMEKTLSRTDRLQRILYFSTGGADGLEARMAAKPDDFQAVDTARDDVCLIGFTSGTTGEPKGTMHFHRDMLAVCDAYSKHVLKPTADDRFIGSPPLAFTFGLGGLVLFPMRVGASAVLLEKAAPDQLLDAIEKYRPTVCFTSPTAYRAILGKLEGRDIASLRKCVSAGETLPKPTWDDWFAATGIRIQDGIGATEMLHIFISATLEEIRPGATGKVVPGYQAKVVGPDGDTLAPGDVGRLAVRGPTGCRYLADDRQRNYVQDGWNLTGDTYRMDADGYFWYQARSDDMIVSSGYNIAGPEVEAALLSHPAVAECGVVAQPDPDRGSLVKAYVVLKPGHAGDAALTRALQDHVKAEIAPYKYPRAIEYVAALPRTDTGKLRRFELRTMAEQQARGAA
ncbi:MAG: benzoate-CoA ligase family protein [Thalassobaculum sp.]|uniref:benzoate-CoA ligase family protein n=1 Tax=Thalassobaculum sp. TaxID=2022740 RepID=UPI0032EE3833